MTEREQGGQGRKWFLSEDALMEWCEFYGLCLKEVEETETDVERALAAARNRGARGRDERKRDLDVGEVHAWALDWVLWLVYDRWRGEVLAWVCPSFAGMREELQAMEKALSGFLKAWEKLSPASNWALRAAGVDLPEDIPSHVRRRINPGAMARRGTQDLRVDTDTLHLSLGLLQFQVEKARERVSVEQARDGRPPYRTAQKRLAQAFYCSFVVALSEPYEDAGDRIERGAAFVFAVLTEVQQAGWLADPKGVMPLADIKDALREVERNCGIPKMDTLRETLRALFTL